MIFSRLILVVCAGILLSATGMADDYRIERLEPPFWWQGFKHKELQLMVYGPGISDLKPSLEYPGVSISRVERTDSPNYLFVYLDITDTAKAGKFDIRFSNKTNTISHRYTLLDKNPDPEHAKGFSTADTMYLITPDRYANGNPGNDNIAGFGDLSDRDKPDGRHGGDLEGVRQNLDYISEQFQRQYGVYQASSSMSAKINLFRDLIVCHHVTFSTQRSIDTDCLRHQVEYMTNLLFAVNSIAL